MTDLTDHLDAIQARLAKAAPGTITITPSDVSYLLDLARKQHAAIDAVRELHVMEFIEDGEFSRNRCAECLYEAEGREECPTIGAIEVTFERLEAKP